jgi:hypothetical protein
VHDGRQDIDRAVAELAERLPRSLQPLARVAYDYRWSWVPGGAGVFREIDPSIWERTRSNPRATIETASPSRLRALARNPAYVATVEALAADQAAERARPPLETTGLARDRPVAYFCSEFDRHTRLAQYGVLGVGGTRALAALGIRPSVVHLNERHAALSAFERLRRRIGAGEAPAAALEAVRRETVFTTHTPVAAGNEGYSFDEVEPVLGALREGLDEHRSFSYGLGRPGPGEPDEAIAITPLALRTSRTSIAVSRRHGEVARGMWHALWPERPVDQVPIGYVTNDDVDGRADAGVARPAPRSALATTARGARSPGAGRVDSGRRALGGATDAPRRAGGLRPRPVDPRATRARRGARLRRSRRAGLRSRGAHDRVRAAGRDLQAAPPPHPPARPGPSPSWPTTPAPSRS